MNEKIINLTQHPATPEQKAAGVVDVENRDLLENLLTFNEQPDMGIILVTVSGTDDVYP